MESSNSQRREPFAKKKKKPQTRQRGKGPDCFPPARICKWNNMGGIPTEHLPSGCRRPANQPRLNQSAGWRHSHCQDAWDQGERLICRVNCVLALRLRRVLSTLFVAVSPGEQLIAFRPLSPLPLLPGHHPSSDPEQYPACLRGHKETRLMCSSGDLESKVRVW